MDMEFSLVDIIHQRWKNNIKIKNNCDFAMMMKAGRTCETSVHFNVTTRRYVPEDSKLNTRRRENLKSHKAVVFEDWLRIGSSGELL
jgi:hypothetical protein